ncbi:hypothetical protein Tco_0250613 [Tanacetum coccineum]
MRGFLWCQGEMKRCKAKVTWESVCKPKHKGGLGIRRLDDFNVALMAIHIWSILTHKESLWVKWIHSYKLNGRSFWDVPCLGDLDRNLALSSIPILNLSADCENVLLWRNVEGNLRHFLVACAWDSLRARVLFVDWFHVVIRVTLREGSTVPQIVQVITSMVHLKLVSFKFKKVSARSCLLLDQWNIPSRCMVHEGSFSLIWVALLLCVDASGLKEADFAGFLGVMDFCS